MASINVLVTLGGDVGDEEKEGGIESETGEWREGGKGVVLQTLTTVFLYKSAH